MIPDGVFQSFQPPWACLENSVKLEKTFCRGSKACHVRCLVFAIFVWGLVPIKDFQGLLFWLQEQWQPQLFKLPKALRRALPTSPDRICSRMLLMTFLGLLLLAVNRFCWRWIPWFPSMKSRHMVKRSHVACRHNGSHGTSAQGKVIGRLSASRVIPDATTIQAATRLN